MGILDFFRKKKKQPENPLNVDAAGETNITIVPKKVPPRKPARKTARKSRAKKKPAKRSKTRKKKK